ncbi:hypothetical protein [Haloarcula marismortui]|uniref:Uncharacterized protein n=1 Tax=Haloarcula marismortui ATCC 33800 TaxID=662476 RepID=A0A8T8KE72_9EURY|nr:hypothetical protein [Haloarcula sinaiiensis]QUJ71232.1 hypothetical protein KDQ40_10940 [Haloarcula sinaiiensis ATCC 33800]
MQHIEGADRFMFWMLSETVATAGWRIDCRSYSQKDGPSATSKADMRARTVARSVRGVTSRNSPVAPPFPE